jgi:hypothetical protein
VAVVSKGIVAGSQRHRSLSGGSPASKSVDLVTFMKPSLVPGALL